MEYIAITLMAVIILLIVIGYGKIHKLQKTLEQYRNDHSMYLSNIAQAIHAAQEIETTHWQVTNTSMVCLLGAVQYDLNLFRDNALEEENYELIPQIDNLIQNVHKLIDVYNSWQQHS